MEIPVRRSQSVKLNLNHVAIFCLAASLVTPAFAQSGGADTYKAKCAMCHGADGLGATPAGKNLKAASFKDPAIVKAPDAQLIAAVKSGKNKMPAYAGKLTDNQIKAAVAYIRTLQK
jgi:cytochrome c6